MIGHTLGNATTSSIVATGVVSEVFAQQTSLMSIHVDWPYSGEDEEDNIYFLVYVDGRLVQRLPGSARSTDIIVTSFDMHDIQVVPWRRDMNIEEDFYGSLRAFRGHLEWTRPSDPEVVGYRIYSGPSSLEATTLYDEHSQVSLETGISSIGAGDATLEVSGQYNVSNGYTNTLFTIELIDDDFLEITNDTDATTISMPYVPGVAFSPMSGIILTVNGTSPRSGTGTFLVGIQPYYDTGILAEGTTWFKIATIDAAGNESAPSSAIPITIALPPEPITDFEMVGVFYISEWVPRISFVQSASANAASIAVYTNFDQSNGVLLDDIFMDVPLYEVAAAPSTTISSFLPLNPAEVAAISGTFKVLVRAVNSSGVDDGTTVVHTIEIPILAELPEPHTIIATPTVGGGVDLSWLTSEPLPTSSFWRITGDIVAPVDDASTDPVEASDVYYRYEYSLTPAQVGPEGTYTIEILGVSGSLDGPTGSVDVTTDSTLPSGISDLTGTPF